MLTKDDLKELKNVIHEEIEGVESRLSAKLSTVDNRLSSVETKLSTVNNRLSSVETKLTGTDTRLSSLETKLSTVDNRLSSVETKLSHVEKSLSSKIIKVQETIDIIQGVVIEHHTKLEKRVEKIEEELHTSRN